jgi:hypothetical protein
MKTIVKPLLLASSVLLASASAWAKLPVPAPTEESKAAAAAAAVKKAAAAKMDGYKLCVAQERAAAAYFKRAKASGQSVTPAQSAPACVKPS